MNDKQMIRVLIAIAWADPRDRNMAGQLRRILEAAQGLGLSQEELHALLEKRPTYYAALKVLLKPQAGNEEGKAE